MPFELSAANREVKMYPISVDFELEKSSTRSNATQYTFNATSPLSLVIHPWHMAP